MQQGGTQWQVEATAELQADVHKTGSRVLSVICRPCQPESLGPQPGGALGGEPSEPVKAVLKAGPETHTEVRPAVCAAPGLLHALAADATGRDCTTHHLHGHATAP